MKKEVSLREHLEKKLSPERLSLLRIVAQAANEQSQPLYLVGGFVRDLLLDLPASDFDLLVEGDAIALAHELVRRHGGRMTAHSRFGTAQWFLPTSLCSVDSRFSTLDLISTRSETYKQPAALPTVRPGSLSDDLRRRDFTINTLAIRLDGEFYGDLHDELGGLEDLQTGVIRVLHPLSFMDDPTRLFRLARYELRYGFQVTYDTLRLIPAALPVIDRLSAERLRHELDLIMEEASPTAILQRLDEWHILPAAHPALGWDEHTRQRFSNARSDGNRTAGHLTRRMLGWALWLMDLPRPRLTSVDHRLHFDAHTRDALLATSFLSARLGSFSGKRPSQWVARLDAVPLAAVRCVYLASPHGELRQGLAEYLDKWRHVHPKTNGDDLKNLGLPPGPSYQAILSRLRSAWLDGKVTTVKEEKILLGKIMGKL